MDQSSLKQRESSLVVLWLSFLLLVLMNAFFVNHLLQVRRLEKIGVVVPATIINIDERGRGCRMTYRYQFKSENYVGHATTTKKACNNDQVIQVSVDPYHPDQSITDLDSMSGRMAYVLVIGGLPGLGIFGWLLMRKFTKP